MILDTNAVSALLAGDDKLGGILGSASRHHLPLPVIAEYQFGLLAVRRRRRLESLFRRLEAESIVLCPDRETADWYAAIRYELKQKGKPIPENDLWIAAMARQGSLAIVSRDPHFDAIPGVRRIAW
jgi:predicted nucleic acid-binding protein